MKIWKCVAGFCLVLVTQFLAVQSRRGSFHRTKDEDFQMLIAGGVIPDKGKYVRNLVSIRTVNFVEFHGDNHFCTGVIISSHNVMTAAHCVTDQHRSVMSSRELMVVFGAVYRLEHYGLDDWRRVDRIVVHPKYIRFNSYDVAVLRMTSRIPSNMRHVKPIVMRKKIHIKPGMDCVILGWGQVYLHGPYADALMYLDVIIEPSSACNYTDGTNNSDDGTNNSVDICAKATHNPHADICFGDLGGPLICQDQLAGIIGGTEGCDDFWEHMKFINFTHVEDWVQKVVFSLSSSRGSYGLCMNVYVVCLLVSLAFNEANINYF